MFFKLINLIKINQINKKNAFKKELKKSDLLLIKIFLKLNIIKYIKKLDNNEYLIHLNYINGYPIFRNIINLYKPSRPLYISSKNLKKITNKKNWIIILSTNKGIITNFEASNKNLGGTIIAKIWN